MPIRRRLALFLDPSLAVPPPVAEPVWFDLGRGAEYRQAEHLEHIARSLASIDSKMVKRRPRNIWCQHPELHPDEPKALVA